MTNKYVSKIVAGGNTLYVKDAEAREALTSKVDVDSALNNVAYDSTNKKLTKTVGSTTSDIVSVATIKSDLQLSKSDVGLGNVTNDAQVKRSEMGVASGVAQLDENGKVPSSQLPSYVDDVIEGYYNDSKFYTTYTPGEEEGDPDTYSGEITAESGKIYVDKASNLSYRWSGSAFIGISSPLALGETASTAYAGDKGKAVTDNFNTHAANNDIHVTAADKTAWNSKSTFSGNYNDLTNKPTIPTKTSDLTNDSNFVGAQNIVLITGQSTTSVMSLKAVTDELATKASSSALSAKADASNVYTKTEVDSAISNINIPTYNAGTGLELNTTYFSVKYGTTEGTACQGNDSRLSDARPASDVYSWAKAATKPTYTWSEITNKANMTGASASAAGAAGLVPAPAVADKDKFLKGDGTWGTVSAQDSRFVVLTGTMTTEHVVVSNYNYYCTYLPMAVEEAKKVFSFTYWVSSPYTNGVLYTTAYHPYTTGGIGYMSVAYTTGATINLVNITNSWFLDWPYMANPGTVNYRILKAA